MNKTIICLVRHGETSWNNKHLIQGRIDIPLNDNGINQIKETAEKLKQYNISFDTFISSPLSRAIDTCKIICESLNITNYQINTRNDLIEREFGEADGITITDEVYDKILKDEYIKMEKSFEIKERAKNAIYQIASKYPNKTILITTHSHFIKALFSTLDENITFKTLLLNGALNFVEVIDGKITAFYFNV